MTLKMIKFILRSSAFTTTATATTTIVVRVDKKKKKDASSIRGKGMRKEEHMTRLKVRIFRNHRQCRRQSSSLPTGRCPA